MTDERSHRNEATDPAALEPGPRLRAEATFRADETQTQARLSPGDTERLLHELQVRQIELERQNDELRASEEKYRTVADFTYDWEYWLGPDGDYLYVSPACERITGYRPAEFQGNPALLEAITHPAERELVTQDLHRLEESRAPHSMHFRILARNGETRWIGHWCQPVYSAEGKYLGRRGSNRDITESKQAEEALRESEARYRGLLENTVMGISQALPDGRLIWANSAYARMYGYSNPEEMIAQVSDVGRQLYANPEDREEVLHILKEKGVMEPREMAVVRKDGTQFFVSVGAREIRDSRGDLSCYQAEHIDITADKEAEAALRESEERWRSLVSASPDYIALHDPEGKYLFLNHYAEGFTEQDVIGKSLYQYISPGSVEIFRKNMEAALATWTTQRFECTALGDKAVWRTYEQDLVPMTSRKKEITILAVARDITARKQAEAKILQQNAQLARSNDLILALSKVSGEMHASLDPDRVMHILNDELKRIKIGCFLALRDSEDQTFVIHHSTLEADTLNYLRALTDGQTQGMRRFFELIEQEEALFLPDPPKTLAQFFPDFPVEGWQQSWASTVNSKAVHAIVVPLTVKDQMQGILAVSGDDLQEEDLPIFSILASQVAISLESARLFAQVRDGRERLQTLSRQLVEAQERERQQIARELHDEIGQMLTGLALLLEIHPPHLPQEYWASLVEAKALVNSMMDRLREISLNLRPAMLDDLGLLSALLWHFDRFTAQTGVAVHFKQHGLVEARFPADLELAAYRIVQEALTNVARHAGVTAAEVRVWTDPQSLHLKIEDRGIGFELQPKLSAQGALGIAGMHERVLQCGGRLNLDSSPGKGTHVYAILPLNEQLERKRDDGLDRAGG